MTRQLWALVGMAVCLALGLSIPLGGQVTIAPVGNAGSVSSGTTDIGNIVPVTVSSGTLSIGNVPTVTLSATRMIATVSNSDGSYASLADDAASTYYLAVTAGTTSPAARTRR